MPRQRQRIVFCDCFDCKDRPQEPVLTPEQLTAAAAVARQEPPPKALLIYATGVVLAAAGTTTLDACTLPHCNLLVREGNLGMLAVRRAQESTAAGVGSGVAELAQLLGVYTEVCCRPATSTADGTSAAAPSGAGSAEPDGGEGDPLPSISARFKGMQAALASTSAAARGLAARLGMEVLDRLSLGTAAAAGADASAAARAPPAATPHADALTGAAAAAAAAAAPSAGAAALAAESGGGATAAGVSVAGEQGDGRSLRLPDAGAFAGALAAELGASEGGSGRDLLLFHLHLDDLLTPAPSPAAAPAAPAGPGRGSSAAARGGAGPAEPLEAEADAPGAASGREAAAAAAASGPEPEAEAEAWWDAGCEALEWLDALVRGLLALPEIRERTMLVLLLSPAGRPMPPPPAGLGVPGSITGAAGGVGLLTPGGAQLDPSAAVVTPVNATQVGRGGGAAAAAAAQAGGAGPRLSVLDADDYPLITRPAQSFEFLGLGRVDVDVSAPVLVARRLPGVVRRDRAERMSYREALVAGGQGTILVDRLLPEVAYKVGRAPKYGA